MNTFIDTPARDSRPETAIIGKWTVKAHEEGYWDRNRYSKSYHRSFGGVWTVESRTVTFTRPWGLGQRKISVELDGWRGDWLAKAVIQAGLQPAKHKAPKYIRLNDAYDAVLAAEKRGYKIYQRTLLGVPADWVIVAPCKTTYHAEKRGDLISGLKKKLSAKNARKMGKLIDWQFVRDLGFCKTGIREFAEITGLSTKSSYTPQQIHEAIKRVGYEAVAHFERELNTLAEACGYDWQSRA